MEESELKRKTAKGLFWGGFSSAVQQISNLVFGIFLARKLNVSDYGIIACLSIFTAISGIIINGGFSTALTSKKHASHRDYNAVFWFSLLTGIFVYVMLFFCAPLIALYYNEPEITALSRIVFLSLPVAGCAVASYTYLYKNLMTKRLAISETVSLLASCSVGLALACAGYAYWALAIQTLMYCSLCAIIRFFASPWKPSFEFDFRPLKQLFSFGIKILITGIFNQISANIFSVVIGKYYGKVENGIYSQGQKWAGFGSSVINMMISYVAQPVLTQINDNKKRQVNALRKMIRFGAFVSFPLLLGLAFTAREFIVITVGEKWLSSVPYLQLFCFWFSVQFLFTLFANLLFTHGKSTAYMYIHIITGALQLAVVAALWPLGIFNVATGYVVISFLTLFLWHYYVKKLVGLKLQDVIKDIFPYIIISMLCFGLVYIVTVSILNIDNIYLLFFLKIILSGTLYTLTLKTCNSVIFKESLFFLMSFLKK
jgi:O-antigen/teichoic acid export membrane protein